MAKKLSSLLGEAIQTLTAVRMELLGLEAGSVTKQQEAALKAVTVPPTKAAAPVVNQKQGKR